MHLKAARNSDTLLKSDPRGLSEKLRKNTANIPLYKGDPVLSLLLPSRCPILRWKIRTLKEQGAGGSVCVEVCLCVFLLRETGGIFGSADANWLNYSAFGTVQPWTWPACTDTEKKDPYQWPQSYSVGLYGHTPDLWMAGPDLHQNSFKSADMVWIPVLLTEPN